MNGYVLAGGRSSRMGTDKARLPERGWPMAVRLLELLEAAGCTAFLVRREADGLPWTRPDGRPVSVVREDLSLPLHPLSGVYTALRHAEDSVMVVPCDVLGLRVAAIRSLMDHRAVATEHPLVGVFEADSQDVREAIERGRSVRSLVKDAPRVSVGKLADRNHDSGSWPSSRLYRRLDCLAGIDRARVSAAERQRQRQRGVVEPDFDR